MCKVDLISFYLDIINIINTLATTNDDVIWKLEPKANLVHHHKYEIKYQIDWDV
jgi:hypothetical protein